MVAVLEHEGHVSLEASDGREALALVCLERPQLVISDILMPTMDGYEFVKELRANPDVAGTKVIFHTAHFHENEARNLAAACGVDRVLLKPSPSAEILLAIDEVLAGTPARPAASLTQDFDREHLRLVTDKLSAQAEALGAANASLAALVDLNLQLASEREPRTLLAKVCRGARDLLGAKYGFLTVRDKVNAGETVCVTTGIEGPVDDCAELARIEVGPLADILARKRACRFANAGGDAVGIGLPASFPPAHSLLAAPVASLSRDYGWIFLIDKIGAEGFSAEDQRLLSILGAQVGRTYENGSLYAQVQRHTEQLLLEMAQRDLASAQLKESERRFSDMLRNVHMISLMLDPAALITYCNDYLLQLTGWEREELIGRNWFDVFVPPDDRVQHKVFSDLIRDLPGPRHHEGEILLKSGGRRIIRWHYTVLRSASSEIVGTASLGEDITERKDQEQRITRLNRIYAVLSGINSAIVRIHDRDQLFHEACRIAVVEGAFKVAWIAEVDPKSLERSVVASFGASVDYVSWLQRGARSDDQHEYLPGARAAQDKKPVIVNDLAGDPLLEPFRPVFLKSGFQSVASFPLLVEGQVVAILSLMAGEAYFFDEQEMRLLDELAGDLAFGLQYIIKDEKLRYLAYYDALTGLANRSLFQEQLGQQVTLSGLHDRRLALIYIDLERFGTINDTLGRHVGDQLLKQVAERLAACVGESVNVARIGADHFTTVILDVATDRDVVRRIDSWWQQWLGTPFLVAGDELTVSAKAGIALYPGDGLDSQALLKNAETALKRAKSTGERHAFYRQELSASRVEWLALENGLRRALQNDEFTLHYQPKVDFETRIMKGVEALVRWQSREHGLVSPGRFVPLLEETGMIVDVGLWVLRQACIDRSRWLELGLPAPRVAVNVSTIQLRRKDFVRKFANVLKLAGSEAGIDIEITESLLMGNVEEIIAKLIAIRALGVGIGIDDFGTGYSSLGYLARLPVEIIKIDRSFISEMLDNPSAMTLVSTMISLAHSMKLNVVAEGVESEEQAKFLRLLRCDQMQGYLISKPLPFDDMTTYLARNH